jgi:glutamate synthase domain-containing protein 3
VVVVLGPIGANFGAGMTGGRAYLLDPSGRHVAALAADSVTAVRLSEALRTRSDGTERFDELFGLLHDHAAAGSELARRLVLSESLAADSWLVEPIGTTTADDVLTEPATSVNAAVPLRA